MSKLTPSRLAAVLSLAVGLTVLLPRVASADVQPGDLVTKENQDKIKGLVADGVQWCVNRGMEMKIVPYQKIPLPKLYQEATEKYASQVKLKEDQTLEGYIAGRPFPARLRRSEGGDEAHVQLRAHALLHRRPRAPSLRRRHRPAPSRSARPAALQRRAPLRARLAARVQFSGRLHIDPKPEIVPNKDAAFRKAVSTRCSSRSI